MQGTIAFDGTLSGSIAGGGGGGGSEVSITPVLTEGEEIADFEIDGTPGKLYAPESLINSVQIPLLMVDKQLRIDLSSYYTKAEIAIELQIYQRQMESIDSQVDISGTHSNQISLTFDIDDYQKKLIAGSNITINPVTNEISASGGSSWDYSASEVNTGQKWIDGKDIYCKVVTENVVAGDNSIVISGADEVLPMTMFTGMQNNGTTQIMMGYIYNLSDDYIRGYFSGDTIHIEMGSSAATWYTKVRIIVYYTKS